ncbi:MAG: hypothetical protein SNG35_00150 [Rikenellaceae bacterium]
MKKLFVLTLLLCAVSMGYAQKVLERMENAQALKLDFGSEGYVRPLTVEIQVVDSLGRIEETWSLTKHQAEVELKNSLANIRDWATYKTTKKYNVDILIAPVITVRTNENGDGYEAIVVGFLGNYANWATATEADYEWMRIVKGQSLYQSVKSVAK